MADAGAIRAGRSYVELSTRDGPLKAGLQAAEKRLRDWAGGINALGTRLFVFGAGIVAPLFAAAKSSADLAKQLFVAAANTGINVERLSELKSAAQLAGVSFEELTGGIEHLQDMLAKGSMGAQKALKVFHALGIDIGELAKADTVKQLEMISAALAKIENPDVRAGLARRIAPGIAPLLAAPGGVAGMVGQAKAQGLPISGAELNQSRELGKSLNLLNALFDRLKFTVGSAVAPVFADLVKSAAPYVKLAADWVRENSGLLVSVLKVGGAIVGAAAAMKAFSFATTTVIDAVKFMIPGISKASITTYVIKGIIAAAPVALSALTALFTVPGALAAGLLAAVVGLGAAFFKFSAEGRDALGAFKGAWGRLKGDALTAWDGIVEAVKSGDMAAAGKIAWLGLKIGFLDVVTELKIAWIDLVKFMQVAWTKLTIGTASSMSNWSEGFQTAWEALKIAATGDTQEEKQRKFNARKEAIAKQNSAVQEALAQDQSRRIAELNKMAEEAKARAGAPDAELAAARQELNAAVEAAAARARNKAAGAAAGLDDHKPELPGTRSTEGTFSAAAALGLAGGGVQQQQLDQLKGIRAALEDIGKEQRNTGLRFA